MKQPGPRSLNPDAPQGLQQLAERVCEASCQHRRPARGSPGNGFSASVIPRGAGQSGLMTLRFYVKLAPCRAADRVGQSTSDRPPNLKSAKFCADGFDRIRPLQTKLRVTFCFRSSGAELILSTPTLDDVYTRGSRIPGTKVEVASMRPEHLLSDFRRLLHELG